ncbi:LTA synthase family protein [Flavihumibacter fluvii]|uniref:LTA synthase family protein n=1 Tax=Flavihumibacter fluvii TaxID=2838157 RepID=UPI001BDE79C2|nr:alkaline phosphatase family protein [Flavihumibacter fluvii]ULQ53658.1 sulfatase-like hydrolase/transferase [Flavihumibacter fluvii]
MYRIPRIVRWTLSIFAILVLAMSAARVFSWYEFRLPVAGSGSNIPTFLLGLRYDARVSAAISLFIFLLASIPVMNPFRNQKAIRGWNYFLAFICLGLTIFYVTDFLHFRYLNQRLNASAMTFLEDATISAAMVWQTYPVIRIVLVVIFATWLFYRLVKSLLKGISSTGTGKSHRTHWFSYIACFLFFSLCIFGRIGQYPLRWSDAFDLGSDFRANIALNPLQSFFSSFKFRSSSYDEAKLRSVYPAMAEYLGVSHPDSTRFSFERHVLPDSIMNWSGQDHPNIVLVICESFSGYKSSMYGNPLNTTPYFAEMCRNGLFFDNCYSPLIGTAKGVWAIITGIPDVELVKTASRNPLMVDQHTIINSFNDHKKYYFLGGSTSWANIRGLLRNNINGLNIYEQENFTAPKVDVWGISDKNLFLEANKILQVEQKPFFAIIQTADNHRPYTIPEDDRAGVGVINFPMDSLRKYGFESNDELNAFRYTDYCFKTFMEAAKQSAYYENTLFVFVGDHGIAGNAGPLFPHSWTDNFLSAHHVPLLFYAPGKIPRARLHDLASQVDVLPTIAGIANIPYRNTSMGRDLTVTHQKDSGQDNKVFIMDYNNKNLGLIMGGYYYNKSMQGKSTVMAWSDFSHPETGEAPATDAFEWWSQAYFQSARFMLLHNKK